MLTGQMTRPSTLTCKQARVGPYQLEFNASFRTIWPRVTRYKKE